MDLADVTNSPTAELDRFLAGLPGRPAHRPVVAREAVSASAIHAWCDVMGETNPAFAGDDPVAPPATLQMWTFPGLAPGRPVDAGPTTPGDLEFEVRARLADVGLTATLATATDQVFTAELRPGDLVTACDRYTAVSGMKDTALGCGRFLTTRTTFTKQGGAEVGSLTLAVFVFRPCTSTAARPIPTPAREQSGLAEAAGEVTLTTGAVLADCRIPVTPTLIVAGALATRDVYPVHHDRDFARMQGNQDILMNILTTNGLLSRVVGEWSGAARLTRLTTRLRAPAYPHHTMTVGGSVIDEADGLAVLNVRAATEAGPHAEAVAQIDLKRA